MVANAENIVAQAREKFDRLIALAVSKDADATLCDLERSVFESVIEIGRQAIEAHLAMQSCAYRRETAMHSCGTELPYHSEREGRYETIFGMIRFRRSYYWAEGLGHYEMDAALNLPPTGPSDFLRVLLERLSLSMSYEEAGELAADYFPVSRSTRAIQATFAIDSQDAQDYYDQAPAPVIAAEETILVVQADGKGVPVVRRDQSLPAVSPEAVALPGSKKGAPKREGKKKMSTVVTVATYAPLNRTAEQIVESLFDDKSYIPAPRGHSFKRVWATMQGKEAAIQQSQTFVAMTAAAPVCDRMLLTDGETALKKQLRAAFPAFRHVLDLLHALSYLWLAANAQFGANTAAATVWTRAATLRLLRGDAPGVVEEMYQWAEATEVPSKFEPIEKAAWYLDGNLESMHYDEYLSKGWPIATGMVEGACRHVVKDRCERSGQRWTQVGVEGMLRLRCVEENGDWEAYHAYRMRQRHERVYGRLPETPTSEQGNNVYQFQTEISYAEAA